MSQQTKNGIHSESKKIRIVATSLREALYQSFPERRIRKENPKKTNHGIGYYISGKNTMTCGVASVYVDANNIHCLFALPFQDTNFMGEVKQRLKQQGIKFEDSEAWNFKHAISARFGLRSPLANSFAAKVNPEAELNKALEMIKIVSDVTGGNLNLKSQGKSPKPRLTP